MTVGSAFVSGFFAVTLLARVAAANETMSGVYALPNGQPKVSATLAVSPDKGSHRTLDIAMTRLGATKPITNYETELSKQLHAIAISEDLRDFVHEHGIRPDASGRFHIPIVFPHSGTWYIFADGVPQALGQQVMRFTLPLGTSSAATHPADLQPTGFLGKDGRYGVGFDRFALRAGQESHLSLHITRDGRPATDVTPFLGVAAHAVFINASDLTYVHVHAAPAAAPANGSAGVHMARNMTGMESMHGKPEAPTGDQMGGMEGMGPALPSGAKLAPNLTMHVLAPKAGNYVLWVQFDGGGKVRTVRFVVPVS